MSSFDPAIVRRLVADFTRRVPWNFRSLLTAKYFILEPRQNRAIADLLTLPGQIGPHDNLLRLWAYEAQRCNAASKVSIVRSLIH
jgi:hypothetical protein